MKKRYFIFLFLINFLETFLIILSTFFLKNVIDTQKFIIEYIIAELLILLIFLIKSICYYKTNKYFDTYLIIPTHYYLFNLSEDFLNSHSIEEISYRLKDAYLLKNLKLNFYFNIINNLILVFFSIIVIFIFYLKFGLLIIILILPLLIISYFIFNKHQKYKEKVRFLEANFFYDYKIKLENPTIDNYYENYYKLIQYSQGNYKLSILLIFKNVIIFSFQTIINCLLIIAYSLHIFSSFGSLLTLLNLTSLIINPLFELISSFISYSNYSLILKRINNLKNNQKNIAK